MLRSGPEWLASRAEDRADRRMDRRVRVSRLANDWNAS
jgi:hypothetical protein